MSVDALGDAAGGGDAGWAGPASVVLGASAAVAVGAAAGRAGAGPHAATIAVTASTPIVVHARTSGEGDTSAGSSPASLAPGDPVADSVWEAALAAEPAEPFGDEREPLVIDRVQPRTTTLDVLE